MATLLELAELSAASYGDPIPSGWTKLNIPPVLNSVGYLGVAYEKVNSDGSVEIVIANRGTRPTSLSDLLTDLTLAASVKTEAQDDAVIFAQSVVAYATQNSLNATFIETGHSLGGNDAQAALAALVDSKTLPNSSISAVVFNSPGIGGYPYNPATKYNVTNFYDQGDAIHLAGGTQLGTSILLPAGPNTASLSFATPLSVATGPVGLAALFLTAVWDIVGPAHSINTIIGYLQNTNPVLGSLNSSLANNAPYFLPSPSGNPNAPTVSVNSDGSLTLTDLNGNSVKLSTTDNKTVYATFDPGSSSVVFQELAALGTVSLSASSLKQPVAGITNVSNIIETITRTTDNNFDVAFQNQGAPNSEDQFKVSATIPSDQGFNYVVPAAGQTVVENIDNGANNTDGSISVITGNSSTQLIGGTPLSGTNDTWTDSSGTQYLFTPGAFKDIGTLTISQGLLGSNANDKIVINNFDLSKAQTADGYLGIKFAEQIALTPGASRTADQFLTGNYTPDTLTTSLGANALSTFTVFASAVSDTAQTISLALSGGDASAFAINTGADLLLFSNGAVTLTIPAGADSVTVSLVNTGDVTQNEALQLTATLIDPNTPAGAAPASDNLAVNYIADPDSGTQTTPDHTITGDLMPINYGTDAKPTYHNDNLGNLITDPNSPDPNRDDELFGSDGNDLINAGGGNNFIYAEQAGNDTINAGSGNDTIYGGTGNETISGGGGQDLIFSGRGNSEIYANAVTDLATAIANAANATASGQKGSFLSAGDGNNTIIGGNDNDAIFVGGGNNLIVTGSGNNLIQGGVDVLNATSDWYFQDNTIYNIISVNAPNPSPNLIESGTFDGIAVGIGNDTIFAGSGNDTIFTSNGDNYIDGGSGSDSLIGGASNDTIFGGAGDDTIFGQGGNDYIDGESGNNLLVGGAGDNFIFGGSGNDTLFAGDNGSNWTTSQTGNNFVEAGSGNALIFGAGGNDTLIGGTGNATIQAGNGNEYIIGGTGNVSINGGNGNDTIDAGGDGTDTIFAGSGNTTIYGGNGQDYITGTSGTDVIYAGDGGTLGAATQIVAGSGDTTIYGGAGVDQIFGGSSTNLIYAGDGNNYVGLSDSAGETSTVYGGSGTDTIYGGGGTDIIYAGDGGTATDFTQVWAGNGTTTVYGGGGVDQIVGGSGADTLFAGFGSGTVFGGSGTNVMYSNDNYTLVGGSGANTLYGGSGTDFLYGGDGPNQFFAGSGTETLQGGSGSNTYEFDLGFGNITLYNNNGDNLSFGAGITESDLTTTDTILYVGNSYYINQITITDDQGGTITYQGGIGQIGFADGSTATLNQLLAPYYTVGTTMYSTVSATAGAGIVTLNMTGNANVTATANSLNDVIQANSGNDTLIAGSGNDTLIGGSGADTYVVGVGSGITTIDQSGYADVLSFGAGITAANLTATAALNADGSTTVTINDPVVINNYAPGILDTLVFADGSRASLSAILAQATTGSTAATSDVSVTLAHGIQNMTLTGTGNISATGNYLDDVITANSGNDTLIAGFANDTLVGGGGTATYVVNLGNNVTIANSSSTDTLSFGTGILESNLNAISLMVNGVPVVIITDSLSGGSVKVQGGALSQIVFADGSTATLAQLLAQSTTMTSAVSVVMPANVTQLTLTGSANISGTGNSLNDVIIANSGNDTLIAGSGLATLIGGSGNDTFVINNVNDVVQAQSSGSNINTIFTSVSYALPVHVQNLTGTGSANLTLTGNSLANVITANSGNDTLVAGSGLATLVGGSGNDTFVINNASDVIIEQSNAGNNTVMTSVSYALPANVQNITGTGSSNLTLTGNALANVITANSGNDTLVAGSGVATLVGGIGNDTFVVDNVNDVVQAQSTGNNVNTVLTSVNYVTPANVQNITGTGSSNLTLTGNALANVITANSGNDTLVAGSGVATLVGGIGNDTFVVDNVNDVVQAQSTGSNLNTVLTSVNYVLPTNVKNLTGIGSADLVLTGNNLTNVITANSGNDTLVAGSGVATLVGGVGNDTFVVNSTSDVINAQSTGSNLNTVLTSVNYVLPANVQNITGTGSGNLTLTGNTLNNVITANSGADTLIAGNGNATLVSGAGIDTLTGGLGNDVFVVNNAADVVTAQAGAVLNTIQSSVSYTASANVTDLILTGTNNLTATGNSGNDLIIGNSGADTLVGGSGFNVLQGGTGADTLTALAGTSALLGGSGSDAITGGKGGDFIAGGNGNDTITLDGASVVAFNTGNGQDTIIAGKSRSNTLSLGGGINDSDLTFSKNGNDLILSTGGTDSITFQNWYAGRSYQEFANLQIIEQASATYDPSSTNVLYNQKVEEFDFSQLVSAFNTALAANPTLTSWSLMSSMLTAHLSGSDTTALGGDLAYYEGVNGNLTGMDFMAATSTLQSKQFGSKPQTIDAWSGISASNNRLH